MSTKQKKIRTGIEEIISLTIRRDEITDKLISYLHSQGVVIKVERELPEKCVLYLEDGKRIKQYIPGIPDNEQPQDIYVAVEPLIEEK